MLDPRIGVAPYRETKALSRCKPEDLAEVSLLDVAGLKEQMGTRWQTDAHFVAYSMPGEEAWPRLAKSCMRDILQDGGKVESQLVVLDFDNPDHEPWGDVHKPEQLFDRLIELVSQGVALAGQWRCLYTTRSGARLIYVLDQPLTVAELEPVHRRAVKIFRDHGLMIDPSCSDWTRMFRCPQVVRDGIKTWEQSYFQMVWQEEEVVPVSELPPLGEQDLRPRYASEAEFTRECPDVSIVVQRVAECRAKAKARLKGREVFGPLLEGHEIAKPGARNVTLSRYIGSACGMLFGIEGITPEHVWALFYEPVSKLEPDSNTPDWQAVCWAMVQRYWGQEQAKAVAAEKKESLETERRADVFASIWEAVKTWCRAPELYRSSEEAYEWISQHAVAILDESYRVLRWDGYYDERDVSLHQLPARIREIKMQDLIPLTKMSGKAITNRTGSEIIAEHGTFCSMLEGRAVGEGITIDQGGKMIRPLFRRKTNDELPPMWNQELHDLWCDIFGERFVVDHLNRWLAWAPAIDQGPIAALVIVGPPGIGKKLLAQGLAEVFTSEICASGRVFGRFRSQLLESPVIHVDEGFDDTVDRGDLSTVPDTFRRLVGGDPQSIEVKFRSPITVRVPYRILVTANNSVVLQQIAGKRDLSAGDQRALAQRTLFVQVPHAAIDYFSKRGGLAKTQGWIRGDAGQGSDYVIARHIKHLYETRPRTMPHDRFLVSGNSESELVRSLATRSGSAPFVIETIIQLIEGSHRMNEGILVTDRQAFLTTASVVEHMRRTMPAIKIDHRMVRLTFDSLTAPEHWISIPAQERASRFLGKRTEMDTVSLLREAVEHGFPHTRLRKIVATRFGDSVVANIGNRS